MMNGTVGKIVEIESAILAGFDNCSINADHRNMTKFTGRADAGYGQVRSILERWIQEHGSRRSDVSETESGSKKDEIGRGRASYHGPFNGTTSGDKVIAGTTVTGGSTANFNFS